MFKMQYTKLSGNCYIKVLYIQVTNQKGNFPCAEAQQHEEIYLAERWSSTYSRRHD